MRKRNLSVYDIQRELAEAGHTISINSLTVLLREEGFARLPRRADDERPPTVKPVSAAVADIRRLDLSPRVFRTPLAGLFLFVPLLERIDLVRVVTQARLPGSQMIAAAQAVRSLLALKLIGAERKSHVMGLVMDQAIALFAGLNAVPKRSYLAAYSSCIDHKASLRFMEAWFQQVEQVGLPHVEIEASRTRGSPRSARARRARGAPKPGADRPSHGGLAYQPAWSRDPALVGISIGCGYFGTTLHRPGGWSRCWSFSMWKDQ